MYGLNDFARKYAQQKVSNLIDYLSNNYITFDSGESVALIENYKNPYINSHRYIAEVNHRLWSLQEYATSRGLVPLFVTLTLPSEYHREKRAYGKGRKPLYDKNGDFLLMNNPKFINDDKHTPRAGVRKITQMLQILRSDRSYRSIPKDDRCYFRVIEPHKDGTPHCHIIFFLPADNINKFADAIERLYPKADIVTNVRDAIAYTMKYVLKTFDDVRHERVNLSDLSCWYVYHGITRFYTSRTLCSLDVYRVLKGKRSLIELTYSYRSREMSVWIDTNLYEKEEGRQYKIMLIEERGNIIYHRKTATVNKSEKLEYDKTPKQLPKLKTKFVKTEIPVELVLDSVKKKIDSIVNTPSGDWRLKSKEITPISQLSDLELSEEIFFFRQLIDTFGTVAMQDIQKLNLLEREDQKRLYKNPTADDYPVNPDQILKHPVFSKMVSCGDCVS